MAILSIVFRVFLIIALAMLAYANYHLYTKKGYLMNFIAVVTCILAVITQLVVLFFELKGD
jgi:hypothetical protein